MKNKREHTNTISSKNSQNTHTNSHGSWEQMKAETWSAVHKSNTFFRDHYNEAQTLITQLIEKHRSEVLIEVGVGTGIAFNQFNINNPSLKKLIGVDLNTQFITDCKDKFQCEKNKFYVGDASELSTVMNENEPDLKNTKKKLVVVIGNTMGIIPDKVKSKILREMTLVAGPDGLCCCICWDSNSFGQALQHFYAKMENMVGPIDSAQISFKDSTFYHPVTQYFTKWSSVIENETMCQAGGWDVLKTGQIAKGNYVAGRLINKPAVILSEKVENESVSRQSRRDSELKVQNYYDSEAVIFYKNIWGGNDIHIGLYDRYPDPEHTDRPAQIRLALGNTNTTLWENATETIPENLKKEGLRICDFGSAYGGLAKFCVQNGAGFVSCVDLSSKENMMCREMIDKEDLGLQISNPYDRSFTDTGEPDNSFDVVLSIDSLLHAGDFREMTMNEVSRILKMGGIFCFCDIMMSDNLKDMSLLDATLKRLNLVDLGSVNKYQKWCQNNGMEFVDFKDYSMMLERHYENIRLDLVEKGSGLGLTEGFITKMAAGLENWVQQGKAGNIQWGFLIFRKVADAPKRSED